MEGKSMISYTQANTIIEQSFSLLHKSVEEVDLLDSLNRILAKDVFSDTFQPPFDNSAMDGIAIKYDDNIREWELIGEISAGNYKELNINSNQCFRIMTGGKVPKSADTVIPIEHLIEDDNSIKFNNEFNLKNGQNIRKRGSDLYEGMLAISKGTKINPQNISMLAACGIAKVKVYSKLTIGVMVTGDELIEVHEPLKEDKIRATNYYALQAAITDLGHTPIPLGIIKDDRELTEQSIKKALNSNIDILLTTGGVSVGKYDYLKDIFKIQNVKEQFWRTNIKPGKPMYFGTHNTETKNKLIFGLPGNPVSTFVTFIIYVAENINKLYNSQNSTSITAILKDDLKKKDNKRHFSRGIITYNTDDNEYYVKDTGSASSGNMASLSNANCLMIIDENRLNPKKNERISCIKI